MHTRRFPSFTHVLRNISPNVACYVGMRDDVLLLPKLGQLFCLRTRLWMALAFGEQLLSIFNETARRHVVVPKQPVGVKLFSRNVNTFVGFQCYHIMRTEIKASEVKLHISSFDLSSRNQCWFLVEERKAHNRQPNCSLSRTHFVKTCLQGF